MKCLTCVINVRNGARYIRETLNSLVNQTDVPAILVVDNHSTDETVAIVAEFPQARIVQTPEPLTLGAARNFSVSQVQTQLIAWLDSDDLWHDPQFCKDHVDLFLENPNAVAVSCGTKAIDSQGRAFPKTITAELTKHAPYKTQILRLREDVVVGDNLKDMLVRNRFIAGWCSYVFSALAVRKAGLFDASMEFAEDFDLIAKLVLQGECIHIKKEMCSARFHSSRVTEKLDPEIISREIKQVCEKFESQIEPKEFKYILNILEIKHSYRLFKARKNLIHLGKIIISLTNPGILAWAYSQIRR